MLGYVTKAQKGMSSIMDKACEEAKGWKHRFETISEAYGKCFTKWSRNTTARSSIPCIANGSNKIE